MKPLLRFLALAALYLAASPIYAVRFCVRFLREQAFRRLLAPGVIACPWCENPVPLARMNTCPTCGFTSPSSLVAACTNCGEGPFPFTQCPSCGGTVKVRP